MDLECKEWDMIHNVLSVGIDILCLCVRMETKVDYRKMIVPFQTFLDLDLKQEEYVKGPRDMGPWLGFQIVRDLSIQLSRFVPDFCTPEEWISYLDRLQYGLVKDTDDYGTTSVSMGLAETFFSDCLKRTTLYVAGNCGTGGMKVGIYAYDKQRGTHCIKEIRMDDPPNPNNVRLGKYVPKTVPLGQDAKLKVMNELILKEVGDQKAHYHAFVTGPSRAFYYDEDENDGTMLNGLKIFFKGTVFEGNIEFLAQYDEAEMEQVAVRTLYDHLYKANQVDEMHVLQGWGMGAGSTQFGSNLLLDWGMGSKGNVQESIHNEITNHIRDVAFQLYFPTLPNPMIALKSGFVLLLNDPNFAQQVHRAAETIRAKKCDDMPPLIDDTGGFDDQWLAQMDHQCAILNHLATISANQQKLLETAARIEQLLAKIMGA